MSDIKKMNPKPEYLTDEALEALIAETEAEGMLRPPRNFRDDILNQIQRKRKYKKNLQLFSYSMKVIAVSAAALGIMLIVPVNVSTDEVRITSEWQMEEELSKNRMEEELSKKKMEEQIQREKERYERKQEEILKEQEQALAKEQEKHEENAQKSETAERGDFIYRLNSQMNRYVSIINDKLDGYVGAVYGKQN